ncbi:MAG: lyase family protein, partial [Burkholderiaceae bacterium]|nr:lyase family protein [Burkholderiaceae bacterium]
MSIFEGFLSTPQAVCAFEPDSFVAAMLRFEAALAQAQGASGLIPAPAAALIAQACVPDRFDAAQIMRDSARAGSVAIPLVQALKAQVACNDPQAAAWVHFGSTSQDVIDTAAALCSAPLLRLIEGATRQAARALIGHAQVHAATPMLARTLMQPASVTSFGLKCACWAAPLVRSLQRLAVLRDAALAVQLGGAVGTQAQLRGQGPELVRRMAQQLGLSAPAAPWQAQRDAWVALACEIGVLVGSLGKIARDLSLLAQYEVGEVAEPAEPGRGGSSAMPHKRNPVACMVALAAAQRAPHRVAAMLGAMPQEHERGLGGWQAELAEWPGLLMSAHGSASAMAQALPGLQVDVQRMRANLDRLGAEVPADIQ